jgi:mannosyltransferase OCH1-like enzyme
MIDIPKIVHQTWKTASAPEAMRVYPETFKRLHPSWDYILWTDRMNRQFVKEYFPAFLTKYDRYEFNIQRVDAVRYLILYQFGGLFADLDFECLRNVEPLLEGRSCLFAKEPEEHSRVHERGMIVCNAFMASVPRHDFFEAVYAELRSDAAALRFKHLLAKPREQYNINNYVLETTGPFMLTRVYESVAADTTVSVIDDGLLYPLSLAEIELAAANNGMTQEMKEKVSRAYAVHQCWGSWWKGR